MICSENDQKTHAQDYFKNKSYIPQLLTRKFSRTESISRHAFQLSRVSSSVKFGILT